METKRSAGIAKIFAVCQAEKWKEKIQQYNKA
jgi:hypothetical protein